MSPTRYVIIGSGVAGVSAVEAIRSKDPTGSIIMVGDDPHGYYSRPGLAYFLTHEVPDTSLFPLDEAYFNRLAITYRQARVTRLDLAASVIEFVDRSHLPFDRLLIASGSVSSPLQVPGANLQGVVKLDSLQDALEIKKLARKAREGVVVGGGITALELVEGLVANKVHTHYLLRGDRYWSNVLDETESTFVHKRLIEDGVELHFQTELAEILGKSGKVAGVRTKAGGTIKCEILGAAVGILPRKELAATAGLQTDRGIKVNETMETSRAGIFAAGDVAQFLDPVTGKYEQESLWVPARRQGWTAGLAMAGFPEPYTKGLALNVTRLARLTTTIMGRLGGTRDTDTISILHGDSETWRETSPDAAAAAFTSEYSHLRLVVGPLILEGALVMGEQTLSAPLQGLIANRVDIRPIRAALLTVNAPVGKIISDFWEANKGRYAAQ